MPNHGAMKNASPSMFAAVNHLVADGGFCTKHVSISKHMRSLKHVRTYIIITYIIIYIFITYISLYCILQYIIYYILSHIVYMTGTYWNIRRFVTLPQMQRSPCDYCTVLDKRAPGGWSSHWDLPIHSLQNQSIEDDPGWIFFMTDLKKQPTKKL